MSFVYFARAAENVWKLGCSADPAKAVKALQPYTPGALHLGPTTPGDMKLKNAIGYHLSRHRPDKRAADWYDLTRDEIDDLLRRLESEGPDFLTSVKPVDEARRQAIRTAKQDRRQGHAGV